MVTYRDFKEINTYIGNYNDDSYITLATAIVDAETRKLWWSVGLQPHDNTVRIWSGEQDNEPNLYLPKNWTIAYAPKTRT